MVKYYSRNYFDDEMTELLAAHIIPKATVRVETAEEEHKKLDLVDALMDPHLGSQKRIATHQVTVMCLLLCDTRTRNRKCRRMLHARKARPMCVLEIWRLESMRYPRLIKRTMSCNEQ